MVNAENRLNMIGDASVAFSGGPEAKRHVESLHDERRAVMKLSRGEDPHSEEEQMRKFEEGFAKLVGLAGGAPPPPLGARVAPGRPSAPPSPLSARPEGRPCPPAG